MIEDDSGTARLFGEYLGESATEAALRHEETLQAGLRAIAEPRPDVLVADLGLPDSRGTETVEAAAAAAPDVPIVALTGQEDPQAALDAQKAGASEYLQKKGLTPARVGRTLRWAAQRRRMQAKLRQRDAWVRSMTDNLSTGIFRADPGGRIQYANAALAGMLGVESEEALIGQDLTRFYADPARRGQVLVEEGTLAEEENGKVEIEFESQDGSVFVALLSARGAYDASGTPLHYDGTVSDITDRKKREQRGRMLTEAVEQAKESVVITEAPPLEEPGPQIAYVNAAFEEMTGYSEEEILGKTPRVLQGPETEREVLDSLRDALEAGDEWQGETLNYGKDGEPYRIQWNVAPVRNGNGSIEHWVSVQRDVTEQREREEQLRLLGEGLEQVGDKVMITDPEGQIQYVNKAFEETTGYSEEEALGKTPRLVQSGEQSEAFYEELWDTLQSGEPFRADFVNERKDGTQYVEEEVITPVTDTDGQVTHFVSTGRHVTEQREREETLRQQKSLLEQTQRLAGAWEVDLRAGEGAGSEKFYDILEVEDGSQMGVEEGFQFYPPEARLKLREAFDRCAEAGEPYDLELPIITAEGTRRWVRAVGAPVERDGGAVTKVAGALQDITRRKEAERRRRQVIERVTDAIVEVDSDWRFTLVNDQAETLYGTTEEELLGADFWEVFSQAKSTRFEEEYRGVMQRREPTRFEEHYPGLGGWFDVQVYPNKGGGVAFYFEETTERKERERRLAVTSQRLEAIREHTTRPMFVKDRDGEYLLTNRRFQEVMGLKDGEALGRTDENLFPQKIAQDIQENDQTVFREETSVEKEERIRVDGEWRTYLTAKSPLYDVGTEQDPDAPVALFGTATDITERKEREEALHAAKEEAEEADRIKTALLTNMNHELRTPLTSIISFAELIEKKPDAATRFADRILGGGRRLLYTLNTVMEFARLEGDGFSNDPSLCRPGDVVRSVADDYRARAEQMGLVLSVEDARRGSLYVDAGLVERTLTHLLHNAVKFTSEGEITLSARIGEEGVEFEVADTGVGIDPAFLPNAFEEFAQESTGLNRSYDGNGLGLTVAKRLVGEMGGDISIESEPEEGTTVTAWVPDGR